MYNFFSSWASNVIKQEYQATLTFIVMTLYKKSINGIKLTFYFICGLMHKITYHFTKLPAGNAIMCWIWSLWVTDV